MHNEDKVGASAIGSLVRSANKREVIPFPAGVALVSCFREWAKSFIYESKRADLHVECKKENSPELHITTGFWRKQCPPAIFGKGVLCEDACRFLVSFAGISCTEDNRCLRLFAALLAMSWLYDPSRDAYPTVLPGL